MTVTCDTVRRAFGEFQCCPECHYEYGLGNQMGPLADWPYSVCCLGQDKLRSAGVNYYDSDITHPALLRAIEEQA